MATSKQSKTNHISSSNTQGLPATKKNISKIAELFDVTLEEAAIILRGSPNE